jgi:hypothetical protein
VRNRGRVTERNVEIWIAKSRTNQVYEHEMAWAPPATKIREDAQHKVYLIGDLRPDETARISLMTDAPPGVASVGTEDSLELFPPAMAPRVVSADGTAQWVPERRRRSVMRYVYRIGFWGFIILVVSAVLWALSSTRLARRLLRRS